MPIVLTQKTSVFFCKSNRSANAQDMFVCEQKGLEAIAQTGTIGTPQVYFCDAVNGTAILIMEYVESISPTPNIMERFGSQLAALHQHAAHTSFGWDMDSFIGRLPQSNTPHNNWTRFYIRERLLAQLHMAREKSLLMPDEIPSFEKMVSVCDPYLKDITPSILPWGSLER